MVTSKFSPNSAVEDVWLSYPFHNPKTVRPASLKRWGPKIWTWFPDADGPPQLSPRTRAEDKMGLSPKARSTTAMQARANLPRNILKRWQYWEYFPHKVGTTRRQSGDEGSYAEESPD
jgi:hypothetical protein